MSENSHENRIMTIEEVSLYLRIPVSTIYLLAQKGKLKGAKFGRHWRFLESEILSYLQSNGKGDAHAA